MACTVIPHQHDILFGRGYSINAHPGNQHFRSVVDRFKPEFVTVRRRQRRSVALRVIAEINNLDPPGRFLTEDVSSGISGSGNDRNNAANHGGNDSAENNGDCGDGIDPKILAKSWVLVEHEKVISKVLHRLREKDGGAEISERAGEMTGQEGENPHHAVKSMSHTTAKSQQTDLAHYDHSQVTSQDPCGAKEVLESVKPLENDVRRSISEEPCQQPPTDSLYKLNGYPGEEQDQDCSPVHSEVVDDFDAMVDTVVGDNDIEGLMHKICSIDNNISRSMVAVGSMGEEKDAFESMIDLVIDNKEKPGAGHGINAYTENAAQLRMQENSNFDIVNQDLGQDMSVQDEWDVFLQKNALNKPPLDNSPPSISGSIRDSGLGNVAATSSHVQPLHQIGNQECLIANGDARISTKGEDHPITGQLKPDQDVDSFLRNFSLMHEESNVCSPQQQLPEQLQEQLQPNQTQVQQGVTAQGQGLLGVTLHQWIQSNIPQGIQLAHQTQKAPTVLQYIKRALPVAKKLVEFLIEAEMNDSANPVPQSNIAVENILIQLRQSLDGNEAPIIDHVLIMSIGNCLSISTTMSRLAALGVILYELFGGEKPILPKEDLPPTIRSIGLDDGAHVVNGKETSNDCPRRKKMHSSSSGNGHSLCIHRLESLGLPYSICTLVRNLLDAKYGDISPDDTYTSFKDVAMDINLMINNPARFLENIQINPVPDLVMCNDKLYGREKELERLEQCFRLYAERKACSGVIIMGEAGVGKSKLAKYIGDLSASQGICGYYLTSKFDQNKDVYPLATISALFNTLCDLFIRDATHDQLAIVDKALESALGSSAAFLLSMIPSLATIMPSCVGLPPQESCIDSALSLRHQLSQLLNVISSYCNGRPIVFVWDDIQWADPASLMLIGGLILNNHFGSKSVFMTCCYRNDEVRDNEPFQQWLATIEGCSMETILVENMNVEGVNDFVSETLHLSPRITRPLASALHHKTRGNPLFLRRLMDSLNEQGLIYVDLSKPQWGWDLNRVMELKMSDDVVMLLLNEMQRLPEELQLGLKVASCVGSCLGQPLIDILSADLKQNLQDILNRVSQGGFMYKDGNRYCWVHDKIQQAAYQMMPEQKRKEYHMRFGLAVCARSMAAGEERDELFFLAVNQINKGGPEVLPNLAQRTTLAALNLEAGKRSIVFSDFNAAFNLFKHGISFLDQANHWENEYSLSLDLFDAISEVACVTNDRASVRFYTGEVISRARCFEDKLNCFYAATKALRHAKLQESKKSTLAILSQLGEPTLKPLDERTKEMEAINDILQNTSDESIYAMAQCNEKRFVICQKLYANLLNILSFIELELAGAASLRMIELTLRNGLCSISPLAFSYYAETLAAVGNIDVARRLGRIALKLLERKECSRYKASVIVTVYQFVLWSAEPFQAIADAHLLGYKAGMQSGDILYSKMNEYFSILTSFIAGNQLSGIREKSRGLTLEILNTKMGFCFARPSLLHLHSSALADGLNVLGTEHINGVPGLKEILGSSMKKNETGALLCHKAYSLARAFLFRQLDETSLEVNLSDGIFAKKVSMRGIFLYAIFFEALIFFQFARQSKNAAKWIAKGDILMKKIQSWSEHCCWNFENKALLLEAEKMNIIGQYDQAKVLYLRSVNSAREHKFTHEEAIASELAGMFFYERGNQPKACALLKHSVGCFDKWGATAVAKRVEVYAHRLFGQDLHEIHLVDSALGPVFASREITTKKRQEAE